MSAAQNNRPPRVGAFAISCEPRRHVRFGSKADIGLLQANVRFTPKADIGTQPLNVRFVPKADICAAVLAPRRMPRIEATDRPMTGLGVWRSTVEVLRFGCMHHEVSC